MNKPRGVLDARGETRLVVTVIEDITEQRRAELAQRLLARAGAALSSSLNYEGTLQEVADLAVPTLADWCGVSMPDRHGVIKQVAVAHSDPEKVAFARSYSERYPSRTSDEGGAAQVLRDGHSQLIPEIPDELLDAAVEDPEQRELLRNIGMRSAISVPMTAASGTPIGVISFINAESGRVFTETDLELCEELGRRAGIAVENARLYTERTLIAHTLQRALLPPALPEIPGFSLSALYRPAGEENWVGGDFYDAFAVRDGWVVVVGDVAGRGAQAAVAHRVRPPCLPHRGAAARRPARRRRLPQPAALRPPGLGAVSRSAACTCGPRGADAEATIVCGGHPLPYAVRQAGAAEPVGRWGQMLGAWPPGEWSRTTTTLAPGDVLVLYTDGVTDATGAEDRFGDERLQAALAESQRRRGRAAPDRRRPRGLRDRRAGRRHGRARDRALAARGGAERAVSSARPRRPSGPWARPWR